MTSVNRKMIDTNVIVYAHLSDSPHHEASLAVMSEASDPMAGLCVFPQMLAEFFSVVTSPKRVTTPMPSPEALIRIENLIAQPGLSILSLPDDLVSRWVALVKQAGISGPKVFDFQIAAAMQSWGITTLLTFNTKDFLSIAGILPIVPT